MNYDYGSEIEEGDFRETTVDGLVVKGSNWFAIVCFGTKTLEEFDNAKSTNKEVLSAFERAKQWAGANE